MTKSDDHDNKQLGNRPRLLCSAGVTIFSESVKELDNYLQEITHAQQAVHCTLSADEVCTAQNHMKYMIKREKYIRCFALKRDEMLYTENVPSYTGD